MNTNIFSQLYHARNQLSTYNKETQHLLIYLIYVIFFLLKDYKNNYHTIQQTKAYQKNPLLFLFRYVLLYNMFIVTYMGFYRTNQTSTQISTTNQNLLKIKQFLQDYHYKKKYK